MPPQAGRVRPGGELRREERHLSQGHVRCERPPLRRRPRLLLQRPVSPEAGPVRQDVRIGCVAMVTANTEHPQPPYCARGRFTDSLTCPQVRWRPVGGASSRTPGGPTTPSADGRPRTTTSPASDSESRTETLCVCVCLTLW